MLIEFIINTFLSFKENSFSNLSFLFFFNGSLYFWSRKISLVGCEFCRLKSRYMIHRLFIFKVCLGLALLFGLIRHVFFLPFLYVCNRDRGLWSHSHTYIPTHTQLFTFNIQRKDERKAKNGDFPT